MKILFLHDHKILHREQKLYSRGGLSRKILERYIGNSNHLTLATRELKNGDASSMTLLSDGDVSFVSLPNLSSPNIFNYIQAYKKLYPKIKESDFLIVRLPSFIGILGLFLAKDKNVIIELVGCPWDSLWNYKSIKGKIIAPIQWGLTKYFVKRANHVIYVTSKFLQKRYPTEAKNSVGCSDVEIDLEKDILEKRLSYISSFKEKDMIKIGMIGNLEALYKGFDTAIKAMSMLDSKYILEIVGGGDSKAIDKLISHYKLNNRVKVIGTLSHPDGINEWLDQVDIFIQPSRLEGLPRALVEALSRGCACIGSNVGGIPELLKPENIINKNDFVMLSRLIKNISSKDKLIKEATYSISKAKEFDKDILEERRVKFYTNTGIYNEVKK